jgi:sugar phosphate isomerase/epimerase
MNRDNIAVQLYTVRSLTEGDMLGTLRNLAGVGYRAVELAGYGNSDASTIAATLEELGMRAPAAHVGLQLWANDFDGTLADLKRLGCEYAVVPYAGDEYRTAEGARRLVDELNRLGERLRGSGIRAAYHNHDFEFKPLDGSTMYEQIASGTDPVLVDLELDLFWVDVAGADTRALLEQNAGRFPLVHVKDRKPDQQPQFAPAGEGTINWRELLPAAERAGARWYIVEQDVSADPLRDVTTGFRYLEQF